MANRFVNQVVIVTGGAKGIGWGIAKVFSQEGAKVVIADWDETNGPKAAEELRKNGGEALYVRCDVSQEEQVKAMVEQTIQTFGRIDVLVNNAGVGIYKSILDASSQDWDLCLSVNLKGVFLCSKYVIPYMQKQGKGNIINISSVHSFQTVNGVAPYAASKGGITALTRNMAIDYGPTIRVNSIAPGWVLTPLIQSIFDSYPDPEAQRKAVEQRQIMKRIGQPEDIGYAAAFLASDEASFITGTQLFVDGGLTAQLETW
ncbi:MAG: glucose 1-dehydrogenase [Caldiserica bacterium]|jgi:NAD(P)-dependent dehydrogenase (short-subunit alcohol dehydrogenase family)|nr:glucose 1-dehydrogenase [Caldisericota bacterium]MDH7563197.1 glucose 1-dehydrogenase [Caldisericota bacterium]